MKHNDNPTAVDVRRKAMDLLARREHSHLELATKLRQRQFPSELIESELARLEAENLLSDQRYTESYINMRRNSGFGPTRIRQELLSKGISEYLINTYLDESDTIWVQRAAEVRVKKFMEQLPKDFSERAKQIKFLQYRGFAQQQIEQVLGSEYA